MATIEKDKLIEAICSLTLLEAAEIVKELEEKLGVSAAAPITVAAAPTGPAAPVEEEKTEFNVELTTVGPNKIPVIKAVRQVTSLGLKEAKELVESAPAVVKEAVTKDEAEQVKKVFEETGATITIK